MAKKGCAILAEQGYSTLFFCGSERGSMGFGAYARLVAEAGEETAESHVVVGDSLVDAGVTLGQRGGVAFGNHERVVGRDIERKSYVVDD